MHTHSETGFLASVGPLFARRDVAGVLAMLDENWPAKQLTEMLPSAIPDVALLAAGCLGMVGELSSAAGIARLLFHPNEAVARSAEDALWRIWMRAGSRRANEHLACVVAHIRDEEYPAAARLAGLLCSIAPDFAEAHHQRALALHSMDRLEAAERAYNEAVRLNPLHFAALAGLGHVCAQRGDLQGALHYYRASLRVNPRQEALCEIVPQLEVAAERRVVA